MRELARVDVPQDAVVRDGRVHSQRRSTLWLLRTAFREGEEFTIPEGLAAVKAEGLDVTAKAVSTALTRGVQRELFVKIEPGRYRRLADRIEAVSSDNVPDPELVWVPRPRKPCGTQAAYQRHQQHGEAPCEPCRAAQSAHNAKYRRRRR